MVINIKVNMFALELLAIKKKVTFYSVREPVEDDVSQTMVFLRKFKNSEIREELNELSELIFNRIGNKSGAKEFWFNRLERNATALPPTNDKKKQAYHELKKVDEAALHLLNSRLRLYCLRLSDSVVILFNGGVKLTNGQAQNDSGVSTSFRDATRYADTILKAIRDKDICVEYKSVVGFSGENNNIIL